MLEKFFMFLQRFFKLQDHPFNQEREGKLNYSSFEYASSATVFDLYKDYGRMSKLVSNKDVLDVACGGGGKSVWLAERGAKSVIGIDTETIFIEQARDFAKKHKMSHRCRFEVGDARKLLLPDASIDVVVMNDVMEHVPDPDIVLDEAWRVLRPGGKLFINMEPYFHPNGSHMMDVFTLPWNHVFFSEPFRIKMYKKMVQKHSDAQERIDFRVSVDDEGREYVGYLNHMTIAWFEKLIEALFVQGKFSPLHLERKVFTRFPLSFLARFPFLREFFTRFLIVVLQKQ